MKFQKTLEEQLVPEWRDAYCNYKRLKKVVKRIRESKNFGLHRGSVEIFHYMQSPHHRLKLLNSPLRKFSRKPFTWYPKCHIVVHSRQLLLADLDDLYFETEVLDMPTVPAETVKEFFKNLDGELNMVNRFYILKEQEYTLRAQDLQQQMEALLEMRKPVRDHADYNSSIEIDDEENVYKGESEAGTAETDEAKFDTIKLTKNKLIQSEKLLRKAFTEFYRGLGLLKSYSALNMMAFRKILKKVDKVTAWNTASTYFRAVKTSRIATSHKVAQLMDRVEDLFTQHFANENHKQAMAHLRPTRSVDSTIVTFFHGLFSGCSLLLLIALISLVTRDTDHKIRNLNSLLGPIIPEFSTMGLILLHVYLYGWTLYFWRRTRINYAFIFEWAHGTELRCGEVQLVVTGLATIFMLTNFIDQSFLSLPHAEMIPLGSVLVCVLILFCPFDTFYRSSRFILLRCTFHVICAPFYKIMMADFFLADQLTSQITALKNIQYMICIYVQGYVGTGDTHACRNSGLISSLQYVAAGLPYWWRMMQCGRRWWSEGKETVHIANGGKYLVSLIAMLMRIKYARTPKWEWLAIFVITSVVATIYQLYWDIVVDWGLLRRNSRNPWLRDKLVLKTKSIYYVAMAINAVLRATWLYLLIHITSGVSQSVTELTFAALEVFRRGHWNYYRLENEHLNNVGKFRAVKLVPLPFKDRAAKRGLSVK